MSALTDIVFPWLGEESGEELEDLVDQVEWLGRKLYTDYEPNTFQNFDDRFRIWINNVQNSDDQKTMFKLLDHIFFIGRKEFEALCRASFNGPITRWLIDCADITIDGDNLSEELFKSVNKTWFCPVTDSMRINAFLKVNHIDGKQHRPDWRSLSAFSDPTKITSYMERNNLQQLVLLEDFVGSGTQIKSTINFLHSHFPELPVLVVPLVCCPKGSAKGRELTEASAYISFEPILEIGKRLIVHTDPQADEPRVFGEIRALTERVKHRFAEANRSEPLGFKETGALAVMYSNCPNNTLPIIHNNSDEWYALFPRIRRN